MGVVEITGPLYATISGVTSHGTIAVRAPCLRFRARASS